MGEVLIISFFHQCYESEGACESDSEAENVELVGTNEDNNEGSDVDDELRAIREATQEFLRRKRRKEVEDGFVEVPLGEVGHDKGATAKVRTTTGNVRTASASCRSKELCTPNVSTPYLPTPNVTVRNLRTPTPSQGEASNGGLQKVPQVLGEFQIGEAEAEILKEIQLLVMHHNLRLKELE
ncbi:conserved hypothetical protein [Ricinus communis]|uniref:Uncharacterized protein n=1 Tax=Ricinus communis TaxID=3988 RepID=B9SDF4_RICCO|nr:conserved hypothetical protein [Ricinus communis]